MPVMTWKVTGKVDVRHLGVIDEVLLKGLIDRALSSYWQPAGVALAERLGDGIADAS
jgi:hypothetical protein